MSTRFRRFLPFLTMLIFPALGWLYQVLNKPSEKIYSLETVVDQAVPFVQLFVLPYSIWIFYIYACLVYFYFKDPKVYYRSLLTYTICTMACYCVYAVFQTTVARPELTGDGPVTALMAYIYGQDQPYNCFPSIHCLSSYMVMKALLTSEFRNRRNQIVICSMSGLIIVSTLFVKQHVILDVFAGILLAEIVYVSVMRLERSFKTAFQTQRPL